MKIETLIESKISYQLRFNNGMYKIVSKKQSVLKSGGKKLIVN